MSGEAPRGNAPAPEDELAADLVGETLSGWRVVRHIAEGGMGHVYEAEGPKGERAAIKVLHTHLLTKPEVSFRFRREGEILESIQSPHVPKLMGRGKDKRGRPYMVMELLDGRELNRVLEEAHRLSASVAVDIATQLCRALAAAHAAGVVHRDMKPENVIVCGALSAPVVKVLDFSVSKTEDVAFTQLGQIIGTPAYMPPEQAKGDPITPLADVYSVGAILYDMLTGRPPFHGDEPGRILSDLLTKTPPRPRELNPLIPASVEAVVLRAIARDPKQRFPLIEAFGDALRSLGEELELEEGRATEAPEVPMSDPSGAARGGPAPELATVAQHAPEIPPPVSAAIPAAWEAPKRSYAWLVALALLLALAIVVAVLKVR